MQIVYDIPRPGRKNIALRAASAGIVLLAMACGEAGEGNAHELQSAEEDSSENLEETTQAIIGGTQGNRMPIVGYSSGAVEVKIAGLSCSGVAIGTRMVLTSAHCYQPGNDSGYVKGKIAGALGATRWRCISSDVLASDGRCVNETLLSYERKSIANIPGVEDDVMVLFPGNLGTEWTGWGYEVARGIETGNMGTSGKMTLFGRGYGTVSGADSGIMRFATFTQPNTVLADRSFSFRAPADFRPCKGDSGGPYLQGPYALNDPYNTNTGTGYVLGLASRHSTASGECVASGGTVYATKLNITNMDWIAAMRAYNSQPACTRKNSMYECP